MVPHDPLRSLELPGHQFEIEAPKAPSRGSPRGAGGEFAGFACEEEAERLLDDRLNPAARPRMPQAFEDRDR
jgi:hypothetical protein